MKIIRQQEKPNIQKKGSLRRSLMDLAHVIGHSKKSVERRGHELIRESQKGSRSSLTSNNWRKSSVVLKRFQLMKVFVVTESLNLFAFVGKKTLIGTGHRGRLVRRGTPTKRRTRA